MAGRVCMIVHNQLWNDARVKKEAASLRDAGWDVTIVANPEEGHSRSESWHGIRVLRPGYRSAVTNSLRRSLDGNPLLEPSPFRKLVEAVRRNRIRRFLSDSLRNALFELKFLLAALSARADVYHANDLDTLPAAWAASRIRGARLVYDSHELWLGSVRYLRETGPAGRLRDRLIERSLVYSADAVIHVTPGRGEAMKRMYPRLERLSIVENCPEASDPVRSDRLREAAGFSGERPLILYQGVLANERGLEQLLEAARLLRGEDVGIVLVGHDCTGGRLPAMASAPDLSGIVRLLPPVNSEDLPALTAGADMGLVLFRDTCLNHHYSLPNKLYEYMMAGIPVVASDLPEIARVVRSCGCGTLVDPESPSSIADALRSMSSDRAGLRAMGSRGREAALKNHCWRVQEEILLGLYAGLRNRRRS
jgi:glycosyltransferase involved in cell wall biosynthesis